MTLVETLVAMGVGALLLTALYQVFATGMTSVSHAQAEADLHAAAEVALGHLCTDLRATSINTLTLSSAPPGLSCRMRDDGAPPGPFRPAHAFVVYWLRDDGGLMRRTWDGTPPLTTSDPFLSNRRLVPLELGQIGNSPGLAVQMAQNVTALTFQPADFPSTQQLTGPIQVALSLRRSWHDQKLQVQVSTGVLLRNDP